MATPEFQTLKETPEYAGWTCNGKSVEAHFKALKAAVVMKLGLSNPETANLSGQDGDLDVIHSTIKMICIEEAEEEQMKAEKSEEKALCDKNVAQVLDREKDKSFLAKKKRTFIDLDGDNVNHKGKKKIVKAEETDEDGGTSSAYSSTSRTYSRSVFILFILITCACVFHAPDIVLT